MPHFYTTSHEECSNQELGHTLAIARERQINKSKYYWHTCGLCIAAGYNSRTTAETFTRPRAVTIWRKSRLCQADNSGEQIANPPSPSPPKLLDTRDQPNISRLRPRRRTSDSLCNVASALRDAACGRGHVQQDSNRPTREAATPFTLSSSMYTFFVTARGYHEDKESQCLCARLIVLFVPLPVGMHPLPCEAPHRARTINLLNAPSLDGVVPYRTSRLELSDGWLNKLY